MLPRCTGICAACAHSSPSASKMAQEKSSRSLMFGENAQRRSSAPISSQMPDRRLAKMLNCTASIFISPGVHLITLYSPANRGLCIIAPLRRDRYYRALAAALAAVFCFGRRRPSRPATPVRRCLINGRKGPRMTDHYLMPTYARQPLTFTRGEGVWLFDTDANAYLDAISGVGVCNLGHCHPEVTRTLARQAGTLMHTSNLYRIDAQERLAATLCQISGMQKAFFCNSGAEANEAAIKLARLYGNRRGVSLPTIVVLENAFHGRTLATLTATANKKAQAGFEPLVDGFVRPPWNDLDAIRALASQHDNIVAVLVGPIQGEGGVRVPADDYLPGLRALCDEPEWLLMLDEV